MKKKKGGGPVVLRPPKKAYSGPRPRMVSGEKGPPAGLWLVLWKKKVLVLKGASGDKGLLDGEKKGKSLWRKKKKKKIGRPQREGGKGAKGQGR